MAATSTCTALRRATGTLFVVGAVAFAGAATVSSSTFGWPDILREPAGVVLPAFLAGGSGLVWTWFATAWTSAILAVPILLLPAVLGRREITRKLDFVRSLGAEDVVDYTRDDSADGVPRYDLIIDIAGNPVLARLRRALTPTGTAVITGGEQGGRWTGGIDRQLRALALTPWRAGAGRGCTQGR
jgi:hypothetical protein